MPLLDDVTISGQAKLYRVLREDPNWITVDATGRRPSSLAFFSSDQEISYFLDCEGILPELRRIFPNNEIVEVPASIIRGVGFSIERKPQQCPMNTVGHKIPESS